MGVRGRPGTDTQLGGIRQNDRPTLTDLAYLRSDQYKDSTNLNARVQLYRFNTNQQGWLSWVFDRLRLSPTGRVLELGVCPRNNVLSDMRH